MRNLLPQAIVFVTLLAVYLGTLAPGLTWAHDGSDGGDLVAAAATGGVAHPSGYPLYLLLARLFQCLPVGSLAYRTNLMSALAVALAAALVTGLAAQSLRSQRFELRWLAGAAAGFAFGLAPLVWSQAVITEVYALQAFLVALILQFYSMPGPSSRWLDLDRGLILGLALGNHLTGLLLVPAALLAVSVHKRSDRDGTPESGRAWLRRLEFDLASLGRHLAGLGLGLALYLILPLRALAQPPVNWGNVNSFDRFWWLVSGQLYRSYTVPLQLPELWLQMQTVAGLLIRQFGWIGLALALVGLIVFGTGSRLIFLTVWVAVTSIAFMIVYRTADSYVYMVPAVLSFSIWLGMGLGGVSRPLFRRSNLLGTGLALLMIGFFVLRFVTLRSAMDASQDLRAEAFGRQVLAAAPEDAVLFARGDRAVFALWYFHFALGERPDLAILAEDLLHFDWYDESIRVTYPSLVVPGPLPWPVTITGANPRRPVCTVQYIDPMEMSCDPPLQAP